MKSIILFSIILIISNFSGTITAEADTYQTVNAKIASLRISLQGTYVELSPAPPACEGGHNYGAHLVLRKTRPNFNELYSVLLTLYSSNEEISGIWFDKVFTGACANDNDKALDLYMLRTKIK